MAKKQSFFKDTAPHKLSFCKLKASCAKRDCFVFSFDSLRLYDGDVITDYCNMNMAPNSFISSSNELVIRLHSVGHSYTATGFKLKYQPNGKFLYIWSFIWGVSFIMDL